MNFAKTDFSTELKFKTSRSSGKGGQHVNKAESRVSLFFDVLNSTLLSEDEKAFYKTSCNFLMKVFYKSTVRPIGLN